MKPMTFVIVALASSVVALSAEANPKGNHGKSGRGHEKHNAVFNCPPGLAKKNPPCIPRGQARKVVATDGVVTPDEGVVVYAVGDFLPDDYVILADPRIYKPGLDFIYVSQGGFLYLIDRSTSVVFTRLGLVTDWNWAWDGTDAAGCPPGLAKKDPPCVPPGLAAQAAADGIAPDYPYEIGEVLPEGYVTATDPNQYPANDAAQFVRQGNQIYRADGATGQDLKSVGEVGKLIP